MCDRRDARHAQDAAADALTAACAARFPGSVKSLRQIYNETVEAPLDSFGDVIAALHAIPVKPRRRGVRP